MRILGPIVLPSPALMAAFNPEIAGRRAVGPQVIRDQPIRNESIFLQELAHQFQRCVLVSLRLDQHIETLGLGVDSAPEIDHSPIDFQIDLVQMPRGARLWAALSQTGSDRRSEVIDPASNGLVGDRDPALSEQVFDVSKAQRKPDVEPYRLVNDLRRETRRCQTNFSGHPLLW